MWTNGAGKPVKTKKRGAEKMKVWRSWYERQGWKVRSMGEGYVAYPKNWSDDPIPSLRHAIVIRELLG